jgi:hypothetical protein
MDRYELESKNSLILDDPVLGIGINDISFSKPLRRDLEPMQTHYITISRVIPTTDKLDIKSDLSKMDAQIEAERKEEFKRVLTSKIVELSYGYILTKRKIKLVKKSIGILKKEQKLLNYLYESSKISQEPLFKIKNEIELKRFKLEDLIFKKEKLLNEIEKLSFTSVDDIEAKIDVKRVYFDNDSIIESHPAIKALELAIKKIKKRIKLEKAKKSPDVRVGFGYFKRDGFDDYANINISLPLKVTDREDINIDKERVELNLMRIRLKNSKHTMKKDITNLKRWMQKSIKNIRRLDKKVLKINANRESVIKKYMESKYSDSLQLFKNQNRKIEYRLLKIDEIFLYAKAYSKLLYYGGRL